MNKSRLLCVIDVHVIFENTAGEWLFSLRSNTGYKDGQYSLVAGHLEAEESLKACAIREAQEETGVHIRPEALELCHVMRRHSDQHRISFYFLCRTWDGKLENKEPHKCAELRWCKPEALPQPMVDHVALALKSVLSGEMVGEHIAPQPLP